jgi:hypothetical protein
LRLIIDMKLSRLLARYFASSIGVFVIIFLFSGISKVNAITYPYNPSELISDSIFTNAATMSASAIQNFLNYENSGLKNYTDIENCNPATPTQPYRFTYYPHCGRTVSAATIIYDAGRAYDINPQAIMATLQKEQSLITTPDPTASQINCAMGYNSCGGFSGFFSQVDNGAWQFRTDIELMEGRNWWGYQPSSYSCANANSNFYSTGLYPGRIVTFYDKGGKAETVTLADASTAALYCYTPYVGPYSLTGYSGSYNFVQSFEQWFGSTVYAWGAEVTVSTYSDSARTQAESLSGTFPSNTKIYVTVSAINTGSQTWLNSFTHIGVVGDGSTPLSDSSWLNSARAATLIQSSVGPTGTGTFEFSVTTPKTDGTYSPELGVVADGKPNGWMKDNSTFSLPVTVSNPYNGQITSLSTFSDSAHTQPTDFREMTYGEKIYAVLKVKNIGAQTWSNSWTNLATENPNNRASAFADSSWLSTSRPTGMVESSVAPGQTGTFAFTLTAPGSSLVSNETFGLVADGQASGWMPLPIFTLPIRVVDPPLDILYSGVSLYSGQYLESSNGKFAMVMQPDGNLVIYNASGHAIWSTRTRGSNTVVMQPDGNLVVYSWSGKALWASASHGGGPILAMQNDGNLVIYSGSRPIWASHT